VILSATISSPCNVPCISAFPYISQDILPPAKWPEPSLLSFILFVPRVIFPLVICKPFVVSNLNPAVVGNPSLCI